MEEYVFKDKKTIVQNILQNYTAELHSGYKHDSFEKIHRFMPFDNFEFLHLPKLKKTLTDAMTYKKPTPIIFSPSKV
jgi:hypothetical protein